MGHRPPREGGSQWAGWNSVCAVEVLYSSPGIPTYNAMVGVTEVGRNTCGLERRFNNTNIQRR